MQLKERKNERKKENELATKTVMERIYGVIRKKERELATKLLRSESMEL